MDIKAVQEQLEAFADERDWEQFHSPKNLAMALAGEVGELMELFQWVTEEQSREFTNSEVGRQRAEEEVADVAIYLLRLCDKLDIDLEAAISKKIAINAAKYPADVARGSAAKLDERVR